MERAAELVQVPWDAVGPHGENIDAWALAHVVSAMHRVVVAARALADELATNRDSLLPEVAAEVARHRVTLTKQLTREVAEYELGRPVPDRS